MRVGNLDVRHALILAGVVRIAGIAIVNAIAECAALLRCGSRHFRGPQCTSRIGRDTGRNRIVHEVAT